MASYTTVPLPPAKWAVRVPRVKGEESSYTIDWPLNTYNYPYCVVCERWSFYLGIHSGTYEEVIYSAEPCTLNDLGFPDTYLINTGHFERYFRTKGFTGAWEGPFEYTNTYIYGIKSIYYANYAIGDYTLPPVWQRRAVRVKIGSKNQKWANYPDTPDFINPSTGDVINSENYPYQVIFEMEGTGSVPTGTYLRICDGAFAVRYHPNNKYNLGSTGSTSPHAFYLVNGVWEYVGRMDGFYIIDMYEANHDIIDDDTSELYFAKTTTPDMDYAPVRWAIRPVKVRVQ